MRWFPLLLLVAGACGNQDLDRSPGKELSYQHDAQWPVLPADAQMGQVAGVAVDSTDRVYVFHRAGAGFDNETIIDEPTVFVFDAETGALVDRWGSGLFAVPHGISIDAHDHVWLTDTTLNLVFECTTQGVVLGRYDGR